MTLFPISDPELDSLFRGLQNERHVALAVSGGADSMALMHLAARWRARKADVPALTVLTVDHGLRPESAAEAAWVGEAARALGLAHAALEWTPGARRTRIQAAARKARYDLMAEYVHANGAGAIVTAHHLEDQAETVVMRLGRGSGLDGLSGIPESGCWAGVPVKRPLLDVPKARLRATLEAAGIAWLEDPANQDERFERVRVRRAMTQLEALGIGGAELARTAKRLRRAREALDAAAGTFLASHAQMHETGYCRLDARALEDAPEEIVIRALERALRAVGGQADPPRLTRLETLAGGLGEGASSVRTLAGCRIARSDGSVLITREPGRRGLHELNLAPGECALWDRRFHVAAPAQGHAALRVRALGAEGYARVRARLGRAMALPEGVVDGLVSFWRGDEVVSVPPLGYARGECTARFVNTPLSDGH